MAHPAHAVGTSLVQSVRRALLHISEEPPYCPVCFHVTSERFLQRHRSCTLHECLGCHLQFWAPRDIAEAPCSSPHSALNQRLLPLQHGHCSFLSDVRAPRCGRLLDIGCGTGSFLIAASLAGYAVSGIEFNSVAAGLASRFCPRARIYPLHLDSFRASYPNEVFDLVTFFDVLEHQPDPARFLAEVRSCLRSRGCIALSVPNRDRWLTRPDALDFPPQHFLRWNSQSLSAALNAQGFSVVTLAEQPVSLGYCAQQLHAWFQFALTRLSAQIPGWFGINAANVEDEEKIPPYPERSLRARTARIFDRLCYFACFPLAALALPFVKYRRLVGPHLYCLARKTD